MIDIGYWHKKPPMQKQTEASAKLPKWKRQLRSFKSAKSRREGKK
jgi:hypothetical protein